MAFIFFLFPLLCLIIQVFCEQDNSNTSILGNSAKNGEKKNAAGIIPEEDNILSYFFDGGKDPGTSSVLADLSSFFQFDFGFFSPKSAAADLSGIENERDLQQVIGYILVSVIPIVGISLFILVSLKRNWSIKLSIGRQASTLTGIITKIKIPYFLRYPIYRSFSKLYDVIEEDMIKELQDFKTFNEFFTRQVKQRYIDPNPKIIVSPADSLCLNITQITGDENLLVKGIKYKLGEFLTGIKNFKLQHEGFESMKLNPTKSDSKIYQAIFYLNPGDYHRYHSCHDITFTKRNHIVGYLSPVKLSYISKYEGVYENNERVALFGEYIQGFFSMVFVGATNVGSMTVHFDEDLKTNTVLDSKFKNSLIKEYSSEKSDGNQTQTKEQQQQKEYQQQKQCDPRYEQTNQGFKVPKGEEIGQFNMGSTVVIFFEVQGDPKILIQKGQKVRMGQPIVELA